MQFFCGDAKVAQNLHYNLPIDENEAYNAELTEMRE